MMLRMGFNWNEGPFELLFEYGMNNYIHRLQDLEMEVPPYCDYVSFKAEPTTRPLLVLTIIGGNEVY